MFISSGKRFGSITFQYISDAWFFIGAGNLKHHVDPERAETGTSNRECSRDRACHETEQPVANKRHAISHVSTIVAVQLAKLGKTASRTSMPPTKRISDNTPA